MKPRTNRLTSPSARGEVRKRTALAGLDPDRLDVEIFFEVLLAGFAAVAAHLVAAERHGRVHRLVAIDPHRTGAQRFGDLMRLADIGGPDAAAESEGGGVGA